MLVTGGTKYTDTGKVFDILTDLDKEFKRLVVVHGDAKGADTFAHDVCKAVGIEQVRIPANWTRFHRAAGPIRNGLMLDLFPTLDLVIAFPGGNGTKNMVELATKREIQVIQAVDYFK